MPHPIDADRLWADIMALAEITDPAQPFTRRSFTPRFLEGRAWVAARFREAGLTVRLDAGGNLIGRREGPPGAGTIMIGSHTDTVPSGGRFDGIAGVATALEIARALDGERLNHALEVVDFLAEEPSIFGLSCIGSRAMAGRLGPAQLALTAEGGTLAAAIDSVGGDTSRLAEAKRDDIAMFLELHIEQGKVLEASGTTLGIVSAIVGIARVEVRFEGAADHAGTTPMDLRRDALVPAAETIAAVSRLAAEFAAGGRGHFVATTGVVEVSPNAANVVPGAVRLIVEARAEHDDRVVDFIARLDAISEEAAARAGVKRSGFRELSHTVPTPCDPRLQSLLTEAASAIGVSTLPMASGAGHDTAFVAELAPAAMVFVPSLDGRSHTPEEWSDKTPIADGAAAMLGAILRFDAAGRNI